MEKSLDEMTLAELKAYRRELIARADSRHEVSNDPRRVALRNCEDWIEVRERQANNSKK